MTAAAPGTPPPVLALVAEQADAIRDAWRR